MTAVDPTIAHNAALNTLVEAMAQRPLITPLMAPDDRAEAASVEMARQEQAGNGLQPGTTEAPAAETPEAPPEVVEAPPAPAKAAPTPVVQKAPEKLARRMDIQRRAEAATRRAREAVAQATGRQAPKAQPQAQARPPQNDALAAERQQVAQVQAQLQAEIRLARENPLAFQKKHGVSGEDLQRFVAEGADPTRRAVEMLRQDAAAAIQAIEQKYDQKFQNLAQVFEASEEQRVQHNFFTFVEEAKSASPESFAALNSGLVYSDKEVWDVANRLMEERADLRDNFDEDKLLEAVEAEARKDNRWDKVQALIGKTPSATSKQASSKKQSNVQQPSNVETNARAKEEGERAPRSNAPRAPNGQFLHRSPHEAHAAHLEGIIRQMKIGG